MAFSDMIWIINIFVLLVVTVHPVMSQQTNLNTLKFKHYSTLVTWKKAQSACRQTHTDLITIRNEKEMQAFSSGQGWIGLYRESNARSWKWSRGDDNATFFNWDLDEPKDYGNCAVQYPPLRKWRARNCDYSHSYLCYDEALILVKENKTWEEALEHCRSLKERNSYNLVSLINNDDHNYARERAKHATIHEVWTGLRFLGGEWIWVTGEQVQYQDMPKCPAVRCGVLENNSKSLFGIRDCNQKNNFFCYKQPDDA